MNAPFVTINQADAIALIRALGGSTLPMGGPGLDQGPPGMAETMPVSQIGGELLTKLQHTSVTTFERQFRKMPETAWFSSKINPEHSVKVQLGEYSVPKGQQLWLTDYSFREYIPGAFGFPSDVQRLESGSMSVALAYQMQFTQQQVADIAFDVTPTAVQFGGAGTFRFPGAFASSPQGQSLLPARAEREGSAVGPFTIVLREQSRVQLNAYVLRPVKQPLVFLEGRIAGYLLGTQAGEALLNRQRPR